MITIKCKKCDKLIVSENISLLKCPACHEPITWIDYEQWKWHNKWERVMLGIDPIDTFLERDKNNSK